MSNKGRDKFVIFSYYNYFGAVNASFLIYYVLILSITGSLMMDLEDHKIFIM
jgi:hypothetical protein